MLDEKQSGI